MRTKRWRIDRTGSPARCVMGSFKPTFLKRDTPSQRGLQASRPPLRLVGCWKQKSVVEATHLPSRAGFNWVPTARAGLSKIVRCVRFFSSLSLLKASGQSFFAVIPLFIWTLFCKTTGIASFLQFFSFILFVKYTLCPKNTFYSCCIFSSANNLPAPFINGILKLSTV